MFVKRNGILKRMARKTAQEAEKTREELLRVGQELFARNGFEAVSAEEIAGGASVTRGALYHHFGGKLGLFREVVTAVFEAQGVAILEKAEAQSDPREALLAGCAAFIRYSLRQEYRRIVMIDAPSVLGIDEWHDLDRKYTTSTLKAALEELPRSHALGDIDALTEALSGAMNQLSLWAGAEGTVGRAEEMIRTLLMTLGAAPVRDA